MTRDAIPERDLEPLAERVTTTVLRAQGAREGSPAAREISRVVIREIDEGRVFVGGRRTEERLYRFIVTTPIGALDATCKARLVEDLAKAVLEAEGTPFSEADAHRVWCVVNEIPDGNWGSAGRIFRWRDIKRWVARRDFRARKAERSSREESSAGS